MKIQISKEIVIDGMQKDPNRSHLFNYLEEISKRSRSKHNKTREPILNTKEKPENNLPLWVKLNTASMKKNTKGKYYVFK